ncbi:hypothetical protein K458DRAFT_20603 [Lentithecium fluviatile CBS 122367]|uniref:Uncharacterized protein n=1 Tax=Lentithecium fluviatile CBS 122367 TaxID=1168545 RepID=A0A6G1J4J6_9PLEO|nr:hypothetical protein K458DRAFT_20603 [Lentithecium fluviatile CBS 122367]
MPYPRIVLPAFEAENLIISTILISGIGLLFIIPAFMSRSSGRMRYGVRPHTTPRHSAFPLHGRDPMPILHPGSSSIRGSGQQPFRFRPWLDTLEGPESGDSARPPVVGGQVDGMTPVEQHIVRVLESIWGCQKAMEEHLENERVRCRLSQPIVRIGGLEPEDEEIPAVRPLPHPRQHGLVGPRRRECVWEYPLGYDPDVNGGYIDERGQLRAGVIPGGASFTDPQRLMREEHVARNLDGTPVFPQVRGDLGGHYMHPRHLRHPRQLWHSYAGNIDQDGDYVLRPAGYLSYSSGRQDERGNARGSTRYIELDDDEIDRAAERYRRRYELYRPYPPYIGSVLRERYERERERGESTEVHHHRSARRNSEHAAPPEDDEEELQQLSQEQRSLREEVEQVQRWYVAGGDFESDDPVHTWYLVRTELDERLNSLDKEREEVLEDEERGEPSTRAEYREYIHHFEEGRGRRSDERHRSRSECGSDRDRDESRSRRRSNEIYRRRHESELNRDRKSRSRTRERSYRPRYESDSNRDERLWSRRRNDEHRSRRRDDSEDGGGHQRRQEDSYHRSRRDHGSRSRSHSHGGRNDHHRSGRESDSERDSRRRRHNRSRRISSDNHYHSKNSNDSERDGGESRRSREMEHRSSNDGERSSDEGKVAEEKKERGIEEL